MSKITREVTWQNITPGGMICKSGNSEEFITGDWRVVRPNWIIEICTQCMLCFPVCPDSSIPAENGKRLEYDYDHCKGCGICAAVCPFDAIEMINEINNSEKETDE